MQLLLARARHSCCTRCPAGLDSSAGVLLTAATVAALAATPNLIRWCPPAVTGVRVTLAEVCCVIAMLISLPRDEPAPSTPRLLQAQQPVHVTAVCA